MYIISIYKTVYTCVCILLLVQQSDDDKDVELYSGTCNGFMAAAQLFSLVPSVLDGSAFKQRPHKGRGDRLKLRAWQALTGCICGFDDYPKHPKKNS